MSILSQISDWKSFERLCADLLTEEGYGVEAEPFVDRSGIDIVAVEEYRSHDPSRVVRLRWRVQCKHLALSGANLGRKEVEEILFSYDVAHGPDEGLFIMVSSDYTEPAKEVIDKYLSTRPAARVTIWNRRQLEAKLDRHPQLMRRYSLVPASPDFVSAFAEFTRYAPLTTLFISDQSVMAHNLVRALREASVEVVFLPFWNYRDPARLRLMLATYSAARFGLVLCFLGDSFGWPMPQPLVEFLAALHAQGSPVMFFPFIAWSRAKGLYRVFDGFCPAELLEADEMSLNERQVLSDYRRGDFRWILAFDSFAEDRYTEYDPQDAESQFSDGIKGRFGLSHSYEFLRPSGDARVVWNDTSGNPFLVVKEASSGRVCYLNSCCHGCMSPVAITSPLEASQEFPLVVRNCLRWLLERKGGSHSQVTVIR